MTACSEQACSINIRYLSIGRELKLLTGREYLVTLRLMVQHRGLGASPDDLPELWVIWLRAYS